MFLYRTLKQSAASSSCQSIIIMPAAIVRTKYSPTFLKITAALRAIDHNNTLATAKRTNAIRWIKGSPSYLYNHFCRNYKTKTRAVRTIGENTFVTTHR